MATRKLPATLALVLVLTVSPSFAQDLAPCVGDCDADGRVAINEIIGGVGISLGNQPLTSCVPFDNDDNGSIAINELVLGVNSTLRGCQPPAPLFLGSRRSCVGASPDWVAVADVNGDATLDIVTVNRDSDDVTILIGVGDGTFDPSTIAIPVGEGPRSAASRDVDGDGVHELPDVDNDGFVDIVTANRDGRSLSVLLGNGDATFDRTEDIDLEASRPHAVGFGDRREGINDLVVASAAPGSGDLRTILGLAVGTVQLANVEPRDIAILDADGDGILDVAASNVESNDVSILLGLGDGMFDDALQFPVGTGPRRLAAGDIDGDGIADIVTVNQTSDDISVLTNAQGTAGDSMFEPPLHYPVGTNPRGVEIADIDGDGRNDVVVANRGGDSLSILLGTASGRLRRTYTLTLLDGDCIDGELTRARPRGLAIADVDDDGDLDLVSANSGNNSVSVFLQVD